MAAKNLKGYDRVVSVVLLLTVACTAGAAAVSKVVGVKNSFGGWGGGVGKRGRWERQIGSETGI